MGEKTARKHEEVRRGVDANPPPPEPIYDLTSDDETELAKAASPRERKEEP